MRKVITSLFLVFALLFSLLLSCQSPREEDSTIEEPGNIVPAKKEKVTSNSEKLSYTYEQIEWRSDSLKQSTSALDTLNSTKDGGNAVSAFSIRFPLFENKEVQAFVYQIQLGSDTITPAIATSRYIQEYERFKKENYEPVWYSHSNNKVMHLTPDYICFRLEETHYSGGAHDNYYTNYKHFWISEGRELKLSDLIQTSQNQDFLSIAEQFFWANERALGQEMNRNLYFFENDQFDLPENFVFEQDSIMFLYNIYEIKPFALGQTEFRIPYKAIEAYLSERALNIIATIKQK